MKGNYRCWGAASRFQLMVDAVLSLMDDMVAGLARHAVEGFSTAAAQWPRTLSCCSLFTRPNFRPSRIMQNLYVPLRARPTCDLQDRQPFGSPLSGSKSEKFAFKWSIASLSQFVSRLISWFAASTRYFCTKRFLMVSPCFAPCFCLNVRWKPARDVRDSGLGLRLQGCLDTLPESCAIKKHKL